MTVALVGAARNEGPHLLEWIAWHGMVGFDPIMIYDNGSTDHTTELLARLAAIGAVEHVVWETPKKKRPQLTAYANALVRRGEGWTAFFDIDEFLLLHLDRDVGRFVERVGGDAAGIAIPWRTFGSGGNERRDPAPSIERFTRCGPPGWEVNLIVKSIVRAERATSMAVHVAELDGHYVNDVGRPVEIRNGLTVRPRSGVGAQLNHYIVRSREEYAAKIARGRGSQALKNGLPRQRVDPDLFFATHDRNEDVDARMLPFVPELKRRMERLRDEAEIPAALLEPRSAAA